MESKLTKAISEKLETCYATIEAIEKEIMDKQSNMAKRMDSSQYILEGHAESDLRAIKEQIARLEQLKHESRVLLWVLDVERTQ